MRQRYVVRLGAVVVFVARHIPVTAVSDAQHGTFAVVLFVVMPLLSLTTQQRNPRKQ
jgi:hypothetical protein